MGAEARRVRRQGQTGGERIGAIFAAMNTMYASVGSRTREIGTLRVLGFRRRTILAGFILEGALLAAIGGAAGLFLGWSVAQLLQLLVPALSVHTPWMYAVLAEGVAVAVGLAAGVLPARHAAQLDPLDALRSE